MTLRILASILLLFSILFMPFWVSVILALAGIVYFNIFWEAVVLFFLSDLLYGAQEMKFHGMTFVSFIVFLAILITAETLKKKIKFYS